ncbi:MAG: PorP/SprF family type IX secretion system membrane protein [Cytophagales bacterium]|nr:PorP/SprF family type IX secretion system membrane protein [Cytophagales bacterium]
MNRYKSFIFIFLTIPGSLTVGLAQQPNLIQFQRTPFLTNPGMLGALSRPSVSFNFQNRASAAGTQYVISMASAFYPISIGSHRLGMGMSFLNDRASGFINTNGGILGIATGIQLSNKHLLSLGIQGGFFSENLGDSFQFSTDQQFIEGIYQPNLPTGENFSAESAQYMNLSTGLYWQFYDQNEQQRAFAGLSIFNFNEPDRSYVEKDNINLTMKGIAGWRIYQGRVINIYPNFRWVANQGYQMLSGGSWFNFYLNSQALSTQQLSLGLWYNSTNSGSTTIELSLQQVRAGLSYEIPMGNDLNRQQNGTFEVSIAWFFKQKRKLRSAKNIAEKTNMKMQQAVKSESESSNEPPEKKEVTSGESPKMPPPIEDRVSDSEPKVESQVNWPMLTPEERALFEMDIRFDLNSTDIDASSKEFLHKIVKVLKEKEWVKVKLIGHTCSVGTAERNIIISNERAQKVREFIIGLGIPEHRLQASGLGETRPILSNGTLKGRMQNRRVSFEISK